jgi:pimeloyl-ACP methyl ester carboxylesterase
MTQIRSVTDWRERGSLNFFLKSMDVLFSRGITLVMVDCPTDQWGVAQGNPLSCDDAFRESETHANDVRQIMAVLKAQFGIQKFFVMGHSYGTVSSRWLALRLGREIAGSIHSASMTGSVRMPMGRFGSSVSRMDMSKVLAPYVFMHNEDDQCANTSFKTIQAWHGSKLITLHGGEPSGDVCGGKHYHSYAGIEDQAALAVVDWIRQQEAPASAQ